jgi:hypothetical protein
MSDSVIVLDGRITRMEVTGRVLPIWMKMVFINFKLCYANKLEQYTQAASWERYRELNPWDNSSFEDYVGSGIWPKKQK